MSPADTSPPCNPLGKFKEQISPQIRPLPPPSPTHHLNHAILSMGLKQSFESSNHESITHENNHRTTVSSVSPIWYLLPCEWGTHQQEGFELR